MRVTVVIVLGLILSCLIVAQLIAFQAYQAKYSVASFDKQRLQGQFINQLALRRLPDEQVAKTSLRFKTLLQKTLDDYSKAHHLILVDRQLTLAGGLDVTEAISRKLKQAIRAS